MGTAISRDFAACCLEKISCEEEEVKTTKVLNL